MSQIIFECFEEAELPNGVANFVTGTGSEIGAPLASHDAIDGVSFTGSTAVGTTVAQSAADDLKRIQCEMGGKNPTVIMPSADLDSAVDITGVGAFGTTGQSCTACSRAIVHADIYDEFVGSIANYAESLEIGSGLDDRDMGPHISQSELDSTLEYVDIAREDGATIHAGGDALDGGEYDDGFFVEPTVVADVESDMRIAQEEVFGPVLAVLKVSNFEEAVEVANDVEYGLSVSIVTQGLTEANRFVEEVEAGVAKVNEKTTGLELRPVRRLQELLD